MKNLIETIEDWIDTRIMNKTEIAFVKRRIDAVSYTHLPLPTILLV